MTTIDSYRGYEIIVEGEKRYRVELEGAPALADFTSIEEARAEIDNAEAIWAEWEASSMSRGRAATSR